MANWSNPVLTSTYTNFMNELKDRDTDLALQFDGTSSSNLAAGTIRWNSSINRWQKWSGTTWSELTTSYALTGLSTTGNVSVGGTLTVTQAAALNGGGTSTTPVTADNSTAIATTAYVKAQLLNTALTGIPTAPTAASGTSSAQIATTAYVTDAVSNGGAGALLLSGGTMTGAITLAGDPTADLHAIPKRWIEGLAPKDSCRVATTTPLTVNATSNTLTNAGTLVAINIDSLPLSSGDRVLVKDQATTAQNGLYTVTTVGSTSVPWVLTRATDGDSWNDLIGAYATIEEGTENNDSFWLSRTARGGTLGSTAVRWQLISNDQVAAIGTIATNGLITRTAAGVVTTRSIAVSGAGLTVTNPDGVAGNPTVTSDATYANTPGAVVARDPSGNFAAGILTLTGVSYSGNIDSTSTGYLDLPAGTTAQRPGAPSSGMIRYNSSLGQFEGYSGTVWGQLGGGATGAGGDAVFLENDQTVTTSYTLTTGRNAVSAGPITVNSGITVTVPSGANWSIV